MNYPSTFSLSSYLTIMLFSKNVDSKWFMFLSKRWFYQTESTYWSVYSSFSGSKYFSHQRSLRHFIQNNEISVRETNGYSQAENAQQKSPRESLLYHKKKENQRFADTVFESVVKTSTNKLMKLRETAGKQPWSMKR